MLDALRCMQPALVKQAGSHWQSLLLQHSCIAAHCNGSTLQWQHTCRRAAGISKCTRQMHDSYGVALNV
jgi:hypothetical protein